MQGPPPLGTLSLVTPSTIKRISTITDDVAPAGLPPSSLNHDRWQQVCRRAVSAQDPFLYGVTSTGIYCRPGCASRLPRPENVSFFETAEAAERQGYRACKRCRPRDVHPQSVRAEGIRDACRRLGDLDSPPDHRALAAELGMTLAHFQRAFRAAVGLTPKQYVQGARRERIQRELLQGSSVTRAMVDAGFVSSGRFYEAAPELLGMTPSAFRKGGLGATIDCATARCSLGWVLVASTSRGVCAVELGSSADALLTSIRARFHAAEITVSSGKEARWLSPVLRFIERPTEPLQLPLDVRATAFQRRVWHALMRTRPGQTLSYTQLACKIGAPDSARAVAGACAANPVALVIPCHRVLRSDGSLSGYRWGQPRKRILLAREAAPKS